MTCSKCGYSSELRFQICPECSYDVLEDTYRDKQKALAKGLITQTGVSTPKAPSPSKEFQALRTVSATRAKKVSVVLSHWYHLIEGLQDSPLQFYGSVDEAIRRRQLPDVKLARVDYREGGLFSAKREYFRVRRKEYIFDICAAPFGGNAFFVSWWLGETIGFFSGLLLLIPFVGPALVRALRPLTYFRLDTALMFQESVHAAVLEVLDERTSAKGLRMLSELERKPTLGEAFRK